MKHRNIHTSLILAAVLFLSGAFFRISALHLVSGDMRYFLVLWYDQIARNVVHSFSVNFADYTPPYLYLLAIVTLTEPFLSKVIAIKSISILFDILNTLCIYNIVKLKFPKGSPSILAAAVFWITPTVIVNSSVWGQADAIYTFFLLCTFYFLVRDRTFAAFILYGISISFKAQAVFLAPFLLLLAIKKHIPWYYFAAIPLTYIVMMIPAVLAGRPILDILTVYLSQARKYQDLSMNAPNLYSFWTSSNNSLAVITGLVAASIIAGSWVFFSLKKDFRLNVDALTYLALVSVAIVPFSLPKMHDRYFYPADVFSTLLVLLNNRLWLIGFLYQIISGISYIPCLLGFPSILVKIAAIINSITIAYLLWNQFYSDKTITIAPFSTIRYLSRKVKPEFINGLRRSDEEYKE